MGDLRTGQLTGDQHHELEGALRSAFPERSALERMVRHCLDGNLDDISMGANLQDDVFELVKWAEAHGRIPELLAGARKKNQGNQGLRDFVEKYPELLAGAVPDSGAGGTSGRDLSNLRAILAGILRTAFPDREDIEALPEHLRPDLRDQSPEAVYDTWATILIEEVPRMGNVVLFPGSFDRTMEAGGRHDPTSVIREYREWLIKGATLLVEEYRRLLDGADPDSWRDDADWTVGMLAAKAKLEKLRGSVTILERWPSGNEGNERTLHELRQLLERSQCRLDAEGPDEESRRTAVKALQYMSCELSSEVARLNSPEQKQ